MDWTAILIASFPVIGAIVTTIITSRQTRKDIDQTRKDIKNVGMAQLDLMRNEIVKIYYKRQDVKELYQHERESLDKLYEGYHDGGGNSFVEDIYGEMRHWKVVPAGHHIDE